MYAAVVLPLHLSGSGRHDADSFLFSSHSRMQVYSLGITFQELFAFGAIPFADKYEKNMAVASAVIGGERPPRPAACPSDVFALLEQLWAQDPHDRPTCREAVSSLKLLLEEHSRQAEAKSDGEHYYSFLPSSLSSV
jgi:serine/threonine protein kinase